MSQQHLTEPINLALPPDFPEASYEAIYQRSISKWNDKIFLPMNDALNKAMEALGRVQANQAVAPNIASKMKAEAEEAKARQEYNQGQLWVQQFIGAWKGVGYRFLSCAENDIGFTESVRKASNNPREPMELYIQERELLCFFVTGLATLESLFYGLYALGWLVKPAAFTLIDALRQDKLKSIVPKSVMEQFQKQFPHEGLTNALRQLLSDPAYEEWSTQRNILAHRIAPGRIIAGYVGVPDRGEVWSQAKRMPINVDTTASRRRWLAAMLETILTSAGAFTVNYF